MYAQDHKGLGHISRALTIARHLLPAHPTAVAYIATESPIASNFVLPERCDYIKLPGRIVPAAIPQTPQDEAASRERFVRIRAALLRDAALGLAPDLVLVDHEPLGKFGEFRDGLYALKARSPATKFVFGLRDIMDDPAQIRTLWRELGVYDAFERLYDGIAVYGSPALYDVVDAYAIPSSVRAKLQFCGYVVREPSAPAVDPCLIRRRYDLPEQGRLVVATVGSGSDGYPVLDAALTALEQLCPRFPDLHAILVTGPYMPADRRAALEARATARWRVVARADNVELIAAADVVVGMGGYNSVFETLRVPRPLVIVPRATEKVEQRIRAETLAAQGLARWVAPAELDGERLARALEWALGLDPAAYARRVRSVLPSFDGAARLAAYVSGWLEGAD